MTALSPSSGAFPHVFTLTGNLLAERTLEFDAWMPGRTQRARHESFQVGGKGINVAKMLTRLQTPNTALCFTGGAPGAECEAWLRHHAFSFRAFPARTATRSGVVIRDRSGQWSETTMLGPDAAPDDDAVAACATFLDQQPGRQVLALCGSFPGWSSPAFNPLRGALARWLQRGYLVADTYGPPLAWAVEQPLALVKINADELRALPGASLTSLPATVQRWVITDGSGPVQCRDLDRTFETLIPPTIREVSPTGSGDVLLAGVLASLFGRGSTLAAAVQFAIPYAAANAAHPGVADFEFPRPEDDVAT